LVCTPNRLAANGGIDIAVPIHNHTDASAKDGISRVSDAVARCEELAFGACGCTDHDIVVNHPEFFKGMTDKGIKPLLGIEGYQSPGSRFVTPKVQKEKETGHKTDGFHLILLAKSDKGLRNLWALNTESHKTGFWHHGRFDWELLREWSEDLICTSACAAGLLSQSVLGNPLTATAPEEAIAKYQSIFGDNFYIELSTYSEQFQHDLNFELAGLATQFGVPVVYGNDAHYARPEQYELHEAVLCLQYNEKMTDRLWRTEPDPHPHHTPDLYIMSEDDVREHMSYLPTSIVDSAIENSERIADSIDAKLPEWGTHVPVFIPDKGYKTSWEMFYDLAVKGFDKKITQAGKDPAPYMERFKMEMEVLYDRKLYDYFLMLYDAIRYARKHMTVGPGRGSVGGSLVAWLIDIHNVDPLRYGLFFERFYNAGREKGLPDIDVDFPAYGRQLVIDYMVERYGKDYVASIGNIGDMQSKSAIQDFGRVLGIPMYETNQMSNIIQLKAGLQPKWPEIDERFGEALEPWEKKYPSLFGFARQTHGMIRQYGIHASGIVVSNEELRSCLPLSSRADNDGPKGSRRLATQFDYRTVEKFGFMKMDFLGLIALDKLDETKKVLLEEGYPEEEVNRITDWEWLQDQEHPEAMWELIDRGITVGIFQIEDGGTARQLAKQMKPRSVADLSALVALNRPGPLQAKDRQYGRAIDRYMAGRAGEKLQYLNEVMEATTSETHGIFIFQEQIIQFMNEIGYTLTEADAVRKLMGKKLKDEVAKEYKRYFPLATQHMSESDANDIWEMIANFAEYGFNKSHSTEYGVITLATAYTKHYYPSQNLLGSMRVLSRQKSKKKDDKPRLLHDAQRMDLKMLPPDVNRSKLSMSTTPEGIIYGLANIKGVAGAAKWIVKHQPYKDLEDFLEKQQKHKISLPNGTMKVAVNSAQIATLVSLGAFGPDAEYEKEKDVIIRPLEGDELLLAQEEKLGLALSDDSAKVLAEYEDTIDQICTPLDAIDEIGGEYFVAGVIQDIAKKKTKHNKPYARVKIENHGDDLEFSVWDNELRRLAFMWRKRQAGIFRVKKTARGVNLMEAQALLPKPTGGVYESRQTGSGT
jgi:DNA polymerase-3 subunit alpha